MKDKGVVLESSWVITEKQKEKKGEESWKKMGKESEEEAINKRLKK